MQGIEVGCGVCLGGFPLLLFRIGALWAVWPEYRLRSFFAPFAGNSSAWGYGLSATILYSFTFPAAAADAARRPHGAGYREKAGRNAPEEKCHERGTRKAMVCFSAFCWQKWKTTKKGTGSKKFYAVRAGGYKTLASYQRFKDRTD